MNSSAQSAQASLPKVLSKITRADMGINLPRLDDPCLDSEGLPDPAKRRALEVLIARWSHVYDLGGQVIDTRPVKGKGDEPGIRFVGKFKAHLADHLNGLWYAAARCHVPKFYEEILYGQVIDAKKEDKDASVIFLMRFGIKPPKPGKPSAVGYEWTVEPLIDMEQNSDPIGALFERAAVRPALAAPAPARDPEPAAQAVPDVQENSASAEDSVTSKRHRRVG